MAPGTHTTIAPGLPVPGVQRAAACPLRLSPCALGAHGSRDSGGAALSWKALRRLPLWGCRLAAGCRRALGPPQSEVGGRRRVEAGAAALAPFPQRLSAWRQADLQLPACRGGPGDSEPASGLCSLRARSLRWQSPPLLCAGLGAGKSPSPHPDRTLQLGRWSLRWGVLGGASPGAGGLVPAFSCREELTPVFRVRPESLGEFPQRGGDSNHGHRCPGPLSPPGQTAVCPVSTMQRPAVAAELLVSAHGGRWSVGAGLWFQGPPGRSAPRRGPRPGLGVNRMSTGCPSLEGRISDVGSPWSGSGGEQGTPRLADGSDGGWG